MASLDEYWEMFYEGLNSVREDFKNNHESMSWVHENKISNTLSAKLIDIQKFVSGGDSDCLQGMQNAVTVYRKKKRHIATLGLGFDGSRKSPDIVFPIVPITGHNPTGKSRL